MNGAKVSQLEVINSSPTKNIVFKIRTTQPLCFVVKPNSGIIDAMGRSKVDINFVQSGEVSKAIIREKALTSVLHYSKAQMLLTANSRSKLHTRTSKVQIRTSCRIWTSTFKNHSFTHLSCQWLLIVVAPTWPPILSTFSINLKPRSEDNQMYSNRQCQPRTHAKLKRLPSKKLRRSSRRPHQLISTIKLCHERAW